MRARLSIRPTAGGPGPLSWTDPAHSEAEGIGYALSSGSLIGTAEDVAEQVAELPDAGASHLLLQMNFGCLDPERIKRSLHRFGETVIAAFG